MIVTKLSSVTVAGLPLQMSLHVIGAAPMSTLVAFDTLQLTAVLTAAVAFELGRLFCADACGEKTAMPIKATTSARARSTAAFFIRPLLGQTHTFHACRLGRPLLGGKRPPSFGNPAIKRNALDPWLCGPASRRVCLYREGLL